MDAEHGGQLPSGPAPGRGRLDELLTELLERVDEVVETQERLGGLLDAVVSLAADLSLDSVLQQIVSVAARLVGAKYAALGVLGTGPDRRLWEFVTHGLSDSERAAIGDLPRGHGLLGAIIDTPEPLRLARIRDDPRSYGFPDHHPPMEDFLGAPIRIRDKVFGNLYLTEKQAPGGFTEQDEELVVALAAAAGVVIENARLYEHSARRQLWLEANASITAALLRPVERDDALRLVADSARGVADADLAVVLLREQGDRLVVKVVSGPSAEGVVGSSVALDDNAAGQVARSGQMLAVDDVAEDYGASGVVVPPPDWPDVGPMLLLPLRSPQGVDGVLVLGWARLRQQVFRGLDLQLPAVFAEQAALALQVARMQQDQALLAVFEDRDRIGRDLHDLVIQRLFAVGLSLENAVHLPDPVAVNAQVAAAVDDIDETIRDIRRTIFEISSPREGHQLRRLVTDLVADAAKVLGFEPSVRLGGPVDSAVPTRVREHLLATLGEALSNVARHAQAGTAEVDLRVHDDVVLTVRDDGRGFAPGGRESGVRNIRQRAEALGGSCVVASEPGRGTEVIWSVPLVTPRAPRPRS